ncbi:hypothetical protein, partial [Mesorhizobium sp.]|uniref:hypothetical protein n=1 Tax=Mesorhizobium sp. TaxID=1871066 RepID=UPI00257F5BBE
MPGQDHPFRRTSAIERGKPLQKARIGSDPDITPADLNVCFSRAVLESCLTGIGRKADCQQRAAKSTVHLR